MVVVTTYIDKHCPLARVGPQSTNRDSDGQPLTGSLCIAESCMAWRWYQEDAKKGYCGAFGAPSPTMQRNSTILAQVEFAWPLLSKAAAVGDQMTKQDVIDGIVAGTFSLILRPDSAALVSHGGGFLRIGMAGGVMEEMLSIEEEAIKYAKCFDYKYIEIVGRPGWEKVLPGYKRVAVVLRKEI